MPLTLFDWGTDLGETVPIAQRLPQFPPVALIHLESGDLVAGTAPESGSNSRHHKVLFETARAECLNRPLLVLSRYFFKNFLLYLFETR